VPRDARREAALLDCLDSERMVGHSERAVSGVPADQSRDVTST
jgi:hypothetical protein